MNLEKAGEVLGMDLPALKRAFDKSGTSVGEWNEVVLRFLGEAFKIKNEMQYYLTFEMLMTYDEEQYWGIYFYPAIDESEVHFITSLIDDYATVHIERAGEFKNLKLVGRPRIDGPPNGRQMNKQNLKWMRKVIKSHPRDYFVQRPSTCSLSNLQAIRLFTAPEDKVRQLFDFEISMDSTNKLSYMNEVVELEAGRGDKWYLRSTPEVASMILRNTGGVCT